MNKKFTYPLMTAGSALALFAAGQAQAQAFYLQEQSARGAGRAFSGEAADTGPDSLWWNPAASADFDHVEATFSTSAILPSGKVVDTGTRILRPGQAAASVGGNSVSEDPIQTGVLPAGSVVMPVGRGIVLGLTFAAPYSFTTDYEPTSWARYTAQETRVRTYDIQPSIGVSVTPWLRAGVALNIEYAEAKLANLLPNLSASLPDGEQILSGNGWDTGFTVGVQAHDGPLTVGLSYKSSVEHTLKGSLSVSGLLGPLASSNMELDDIQARFSTPWQLIGAIRYQVSDAVTLNMQGIRYGWSKFDAIRLGAPLDVEIPELYGNSWSLAGGIDVRISPILAVRAGVQHATTPTQDGERDARVPDSDRWNFGLGASVAMNRRMTIDMAANYIHFDTATIDRVTAAYAGTSAQTPILVSGEIRDSNAVILTLGGRFAF